MSAIPVPIPVEKADYIANQLEDLETQLMAWRCDVEGFPPSQDAVLTVIHLLLIRVSRLKNAVYMASHEGGH